MSRKRIVVGFPGDCKKYIDTLAKVIDGLSASVAEQFGGFTLRLYRWDEDAHPGFHAIGPQGIIDDVLKIEDADLFINFFYARLGTPDPNLNGKTGTEHEFEQAYAACAKVGRPKLFPYFHKEPIAPRGKEAIAKLARLDEFREGLQARNVFHWDFTDESIEDLLRKHITAAIREWSAPATPKPAPPVAQTFDFASYRRAFSIPPRWDLAKVGVAQAAGDRRITANLGEIYQPLRVHANADPSKLDQGAPIEPEEVLSLTRGLVLQGAAGSGKTTWMRHTLYRLIQREDLFPVLIELRSLQPADSFTGFLRQVIAGRDCHVDGLDAALADPTGPRPILLIDGWDELGDLGGKVRERLAGFLANHPRAITVVTSRPYGDQPPSDSDGFETRRFQPLNDAEIQRFSDDFWRVCYGDDPARGEYATRFQQSLAASQGAKDLARNPLMMTMMLIISRSHRLPDKRHKLYDTVVRNLLATLRREEEGVRTPSDSWRPDDEEERLRAVAELAYRIKSSADDSTDFIEVNAADAENLVPARIPEGKRAHFLRWLAGPCGLMTEKSDGKLSFVHLSFQEYLAARHIYTDLTDSAELFPTWAAKQSWWETLRLWASIQWDNVQAKLDPVLYELSKSPDGAWLTGCMMADGVGSQTQFNDWKGRAVDHLRDSSVGYPGRCARAWAECSEQASRLRDFGSALDQAIEWQWIGWFRAYAWCKSSRLREPPAGPLATVMRRAMSEVAHPEDVALGRLWRGASSAWPEEPWEVALLDLWPSRRALGSLRIQSASSVIGGAARVVARSALGIRTDHLAVTRKLTQQLRLMFVKESPLGSWSRDWIRYWAKYLTPDGYTLTVRWLSRPWAGEHSESLAQMWTREWIEELGWGRKGASDLISSLATDMGLDPTRADHLDISALELRSASRAGARARLSALGPQRDCPSAVRLLAAACRASFKEQPDRPELHRRLKAFKGDPLWPALARHLARVSDERDYLTQCALNWESYPAPLSWGLRYMAKGDILLQDLTTHWDMDDLAREAGVEPLPIVDPMEPELQVDRDADLMDDSNLRSAGPRTR